MLCDGCATPREDNYGQWWQLNGYHGFSGYFCPDCYDKISHDSYGQPNYPKDLMLMVLKKSYQK